MLSNIFVRLLPSIRTLNTYQRSCVRLLSTAETSATTPATNEREKGVVKRFSKEKGYGFIAKNSDGTDYFVHFKHINTTGFKTLEVGQEVEFTVVQGEKGVEARDVNITNAGTTNESFSFGSSNNNSTSFKFGFGSGGSRNRSSALTDFDATNSSTFTADESASTFPRRKSSRMFGDLSRSNTDSFFSPKTSMSYADGKRETGSVKRWTDERGFGFIRRTNGGSDLFCHARSLKDGLQALQEGQTVEFRIQATEKGEEARDVTVTTGETSRTEPSESSSTATSEQRQTGIVKRWIGDKGYGFLQRESGGPDVFVHLRGLNNGVMSLEEGQTVEFDLIKNDKGEMAQNVTVSDTA